MKKSLLSTYASERQRVLEDITQSLSTDERFIAAWLTGSYARDEADEVSDLDLTVVVAETESKKLCKRERQVSYKTTPERLELFSQFGQPAMVHENNNNAPEGGTFTFVLYSGSGVMVDWVLMPPSGTARPEPSRLLFDKAGIPIRPPAASESLEERIEKGSEMIDFFWMMTAITIKYAIRNDGVFVQNWLENLTEQGREIERLIEGNPSSYHRGSWTKPFLSKAEQIKAIRNLNARMETLRLRLNKLGGSIPAVPLAEIEVLLSIAKGTEG